MTRIDRYFTLRWLSSFAKVAVGMMILYCVIDLLAERRNEIIDHEIPWSVVLNYYVSSLPLLLYQTAPLAILVSALMVFGDAAQNNEIVAVNAGGVGLRRLLCWPFVAVAIVCAIMFVFDDRVGAAATARAEAIDDEFFSRTVDYTRSGVSLPALEDGWTCHILKYNRRANTGETVYMYALRDDRNEHITARRIYWREGTQQWMIEDGWWTVNAPDWSRELSRKRITRLVAPIKETPDVLFALDVPPETKTLRTIREDIRRAEQRGQEALSEQVALHTNFSYPVLNFVMMIIAIPCALWLGRGGLGISFGAAIAIAITYLLAHGMLVKLGQIGTIPPMAAAWAANIVFLSAGMLMFWRTPN